MQLMALILNKGHHLFVDNWYIIPSLFRLLSRHDTPVCGTVWKNRARFLTEIINRKINKGEYIHVTSDGLLGVRYRDKRDVYFLSTIHRPKLVATRKINKEGNVVMKENVVDDYNNSMGFVNKNDAITSQHTMVRKTNKWTIKVAFHLIEESLLNAYILYGHSNHPALKFSAFKIQYVHEQFIKLASVRQLERNSRMRKNQHFPEKCPVKNPKYKNPTKQCVNCYQKGIQRESRYRCADCPGNPGLCVDPCFEEFHSPEVL